MKTPEEIKKGLECYVKKEFCVGRNCSYYNALCDYENIMYDAYTYILQLEAQVPRWISVEERVPETKEDVAIIINLDGHQYIRVGWIRFHSGIWMQAGLGRIEGEVTHWMPLPESPTKEDARAAD